ncbi:MAG: hypothetical protein WC111_01810 [Candidatus Cloacimonadaceae bacterium]|nr:hypothetical protein [Candidatus Cloacimonadota bacterium]MCB5259351.1 hypothetical protein [Candidatus Cloacimonadota bacterium]
MITKDLPVVLLNKRDNKIAELKNEPIQQKLQSKPQIKAPTLEDMPIEKTGYVMMLDILGFREFVTKRNDISFWDIWSGLKHKLETKKNEYDSDTKKNLTIDVLCLSDTIIVCLSYKVTNDESDSRYLLSTLPHIIGVFFWEYMKEYKIFFRGAISYGKFTFSKTHSMVMGDAIDEVSNWYESTNWIGIILTPSAQCSYEYMVAKDDPKKPKALKMMKKRFVEYKVPIKDPYPKICKYAYYWFKHDGNFDTHNINTKAVLELFSKLKHEPLYAEKYSNAIEFIRSCQPPKKVDDNSSNTKSGFSLIIPNQ